MHGIRRNAWPLAVLVLTGAALATPPKPEIEGGRPGPETAAGEKQGKVGRDRIAEMNAMALRGGVPQDVWLEGLHRLTRVSSPRREEITRAVRTYQVEIAAWQATKAPELKKLGEQARAARTAGEPVPTEVSSRIREIRRSRPMLPDLQRKVWEILTGSEQARLADELAELKRSGLPKDVTDGRRPAGSPARVTPKRKDAAGGNADVDSTAGEKEALPPLLWSFVDDPDAGKPLPKPEDVEATTEPVTTK